MAEEDTYLRAKLTEINGSIERLTDMLNRMIEVISKITEVQDAAADIALAVAANSEKLDDLMTKVSNISVAAPAGSAASTGTLDTKGRLSDLQAVLETFETQVREGVIASDLAVKLNDAADAIEAKGGSGPLIVKMQRWVRILKTYGRVDPISATDVRKLKGDIADWSKQIGNMR